MREIKFKIWDKSYLYFVKITENIKYYISSNGDIISIDEMGFIYEANKENFVFLQYTGLKDKDGREIFEGDLISCKNNKNVHVFFDNGSFKVKYQKNINNVICTLETFLEKYKCTITGNIYENK